MSTAVEMTTDTDLASLADMVVADLALMRRKQRKPDHGLDRGIELCTRLAQPIPVATLAASPAAGPDASRRQLRADADPATKWQPPSSEEVHRLRKDFEDIYEENVEIRDEDLTRIQEFVVRVTTLSWQERTRDFQQRRLKRALKQQSL